MAQSCKAYARTILQFCQKFLKKWWILLSTSLIECSPNGCPSSLWQSTYVPCSITVSVLWISFWLDHKAVRNPMFFFILKMSALGASKSCSRIDDTFSHVINSSSHTKLPPPSCVHQGNWCMVWSLCFLLVFSALLEYALVNYASR